MVRKNKLRASKRAAKLKRREARRQRRTRTEELSRTTSFVLPDLRVMEGVMRQMLGGIPDDGNVAAQKAQDLAYQACGTDDPEIRMDLVAQALSLDPNCTDAYVLIAESAPNAESAFGFYLMAVEAGRNAIGEDWDDFQGHFWGILETRPYMRAVLGLAQCLWVIGDRDEAISHYQDLLRLNPDDNQGVRWLLVNCLFESNRDDELEILLNSYDDNFAATWTYSQALHQFRKENDSATARDLLKAAIERNGHVPDYLAGVQPLPTQRPDYFSPGDVSEAICYVAEALPAWRATPGAIAWLRKVVGRSPAAVHQPSPKNARPRPGLAALPQDENEVWLVGVRPLPGSADGPGENQLVGLVLDANTGTLLGTVPFDTKPKAAGLFELLQDAMADPSSGEPRRPAEVQVLGRGYTFKLRSLLKRIGVGCRVCEQSDEIVETVDEMLRRGQLDPKSLYQGKLNELPQTAGEIWQVGIQQMDAWIQNDGDRFRPWLILVTNRSENLLLVTQIEQEQPSVERIWQSVEQAMRQSQHGEPHLPAELQVKSADHKLVLQAYTDDISVDCVVAELDHFDFLVADLADTLGGARKVPGLTETPGIETQQAGSFFNAAADFYRQAPWTRIPGDAILKIELPGRKPEPYYASVMGQMGVVSGIALYDDLSSLRTTLNTLNTDEENLDRTSAISVTFGEEFESASADLEAVEQFGWPVAAPEAYPSVVRVRPGGQFGPVDSTELEVLEASLRAIPKFLIELTPSFQVSVPVFEDHVTVKVSRFSV